MGILESRLVISAVDQTAAAFASAEARVAALSRAVKAQSGMVGAAGAAAGRTAASERAILASGATMGAIAGAAKQGAAYALTIGAAVAMHHAVKAVAARQHELVRMAVSGMSRGEIADATEEAAKLATETPNIGMTETMHMLRNARSIVGTYQEAAEIAGPMMKLRTLAQLARPGQDVSEDFDQLIKGLEIKSVTQNPKQFREYMEGIAKGINVFGDTLKPYQYYEMFKYGRQATSGLSEQFILSTAPTLAQQLGGSSYGRAVSAFNAAVVGGVMKHSSLKEFQRLGLIAPEDLDYLKTGEAKGLKPGKGLIGWQTAQADPNSWVRDYLIPALDKLGVKDKADVMKEVSTLFQNQLAGQMVSLLATQQARIEKDADLIRKAPGLEAADKALREDPTIAWQALNASIESLTAAMMQSVNLASGMTSVAQAISRFTSDLEVEKKAQDAGAPSPGDARFRRKLNRLFFGVDTEDFDEANRLSSQAQEDIDFGRKAHDIVVKAEKVQGIIASSKGAQRAAAVGELKQLREQASRAREEWRQSVARRGEDAYAARLSMDGLYGRGQVARSTPHLQDYIDRATTEAQIRAFGSAPQSVDVRGEAEIKNTITVTASSELLRIVDLARSAGTQIPLNPVMGGHTGRMDSDAAPVGRGGIWDR